DRPIDPNSFTVDAVTVMFRNPSTPVSQLGIPLDVTSITDLNPAPADTAVAGRDTRFLIHFNPIKAFLQGGTYTGTYSYSIKPIIQDRIRRQSVVVTPNGRITPDPAAVSPDVPQPVQGGSVTFSPLTVTEVP